MTDALARWRGMAGVVPSYTDQTAAAADGPRHDARASGGDGAAGRDAGRGGGGAAACAGRGGAGACRPGPWWRRACAPSGLVPEGSALDLRLEDGGELEGAGRHAAAAAAGPACAEGRASVCTLISAPARLPLPPRSWGVMLPLHALRPPETGGLADYTDLATAAEGLAGLGADFVGLNPIHAGFWGDAGGFSPYTPSHRRRLSAFHLADGGIPRAAGR
jgi:4-alpha-glucanotransferase